MDMSPDNLGELQAKARQLVLAEDLRDIPFVRGLFAASDSISSVRPAKSGPFVVSEPYLGEPYDPARERVVKGGWDHEDCWICHARVAPEDEWWTDPGRPELGICLACHAEFIASRLAWQNPGRDKTTVGPRAPGPWAVTTEARWLGAAMPGPMLQALMDRPKSGTLDRKLRLFACACVRRVWHLLEDDRSRAAVEVAERYADGLARSDELDAAGDEAGVAASDLYTPDGLDEADRAGIEGEPADDQDGPTSEEAEGKRLWQAAKAAASTTARKVGGRARGTWYETARVAADMTSALTYFVTAEAAELRSDEDLDLADYEALESPLRATDVVTAAAELRAREARFGEARRSRPPRVIPWQSDLLRCLFGNPYRPTVFDPSWRVPAAVALARAIYDRRVFDLMPALADTLEKAGCHDPEILGHCRMPGGHARGCWVVDAVLGKS